MPDLPCLDYGILHGLVGHLLRHAFNTGQTAFNEVFADDKITPLQFMLLELISRNPDISHTAICQAMRASPSVITTTLKPLLAADLVERMRKSTDSRQSTYRASALGAARFKDLRPKIWDAEKRILDRLPERDQEALIRALKAIAGLRA